MSYNGTLTGSPTFAAAATGFGNAITLDGATQYATLPSLADLTVNTTWTAEARIKFTDSGTALLWVIGTPGTSDCLWFGANAGKLCFDAGTAQRVDGVGTINDGAWHHVALVVTNNTSGAIYCDGVLQSTGALSTWTPPSSDPFHLGYWTAAAVYWNGSIDEAAFSTVAQYTGSTYTVPTAPLAANRVGQVALYRMDETTGATTIADSNTTAATPTPTPTPTVTVTPAAGQFWDDGYGTVTANYVQTSEFARLVVKTDATSVVATVYTDAGGFPPLSAVGVRVNGLASGETTLECNQAGVSTFTVPLPGVAGTTVEFVNGQCQIVTGTSNWTGTYFTSLAFAGATVATVVPPAATNKLVIYGNSIEGGGPNVTSPFQAWTEQLRLQYPGNVQIEAYGGRALHNDCATPAAIVAFVARLASYNPSRVVGCIAVNDYLNAPWTAAAFATAYGAMWDQFHAAKPAVPVELFTPLVKASEVANANGDTLGSFRAAITALGTTRPWMTVVDGSKVLTTADLGSDGTHPSLAAQTTKLPAFYLGAINALGVSATVSTADVPHILSGFTVGGLAGSATLPPAANVSSGLAYGVGGNGSTGTLVSTSPGLTVAQAAQLALVATEILNVPRSGHTATHNSSGGTIAVTIAAIT